MSFPPSVVYCIGIFGLMMLSLLETILVMYLMEKDDGPPEGKDWTADGLHAANRKLFIFKICREA